MHVAAEEAHVNAIIELDFLGLSCDQKNYAGETPMFVAARCNHPDVIQALDELGTCVRARARVCACV